jgi:N-acetyl sugar amidotransferase
MESSVPNIRFDERGVCQHCAIHDELEKSYPMDDRGQKDLARIVAQIKKSGEGRDYDCICGVSGGRDSSFTLYTAVRTLGLRPLAVHFDNGWNSDIAVTNIERACQALDVDLETVVADWEEFRDLQIAFVKASVPDLDIPTDVAILATLHEVAAKEGIQYILNGHSFRTEGIAPVDWTYFDGRYIRAIHRRFATMPLRDYHNFGLREFVLYTILKRIKTVPILNYVAYRHADAEAKLAEIGWSYYGGHHHENSYSKFVQSYLLPRKFRIDRRRTELSAAVRSGTKDRREAIAYLDTTPYEVDRELVHYAIEKLGLNAEEFERLYQRPPRSFRDFPTYYPVIRALRKPIGFLATIGLVPKLLRAKFEA